MKTDQQFEAELQALREEYKRATTDSDRAYLHFQAEHLKNEQRVDRELHRAIERARALGRKAP